MDGVRQDFIVGQSPPSPPAGELVVKLAVAGAQVEAAADGPRLVLEHSGRKIAYSRLRVTDATGRELPARMEVCQVGDEVTSLNSSDLFGSDIEEKSLLTAAPASGTLAVVVNDAGAVYPVRIDPTFSDANWVSLGGITGANGQVNAAVIDGSGNLYIGGEFTIVGNAIANGIAQWNGSSWSALGSGMGGSDPYVYALAVSGSTLYAGGYFTTAGGSAATNIAQWNGSSWSALGSGMDNGVLALAVSGSTLYAGGEFTTAGGSAATNIAQWNGSSWSALGSGIVGGVSALASSTLYAGGEFTIAGTNVSAYAAEASLAGTPVSPALALITANAAFSFTNGVFGFEVAGPAGSNVVIQASTNLQTWIPLQTNLLGSGLLHFSDAQSPANRHRFYRAQLSP
jgi:hypothetical protein